MSAVNKAHMASQAEPSDVELPVERCNGTALRKASRRLSQFYDAAIAPSGLRGTQKAILSAVARSNGITTGRLASEMSIDRTALAHNMKPLQRDGLIRIEIDAEDRRARRLVVTDAGKERLAASEPLWEAAQRRFEAVYGVEEALELRRTMARIAKLKL